MNHFVHAQIGKYFALHSSAEMKEIFWSTAIKNFGVSMVVIFEPIFLYRNGFSIPEVLLYYIAISVLYLLVVPFGARICRRHGYERAILISSPFLIIYFLGLFMIPVNTPVAVGIALISITIRRMLYWPSFHAYFVTAMNRSEEGREVSNQQALSMVLTAFAPAIGGVIISLFGFTALFLVVAGIILLSNLPLLRTPEVFIPTDFPYKEMIRRLFNPKAARRFLAFVGIGELQLTLILWPLFIALVVPDLLALGGIISLARMANVFVMLYVGRLSDGGAKQGLLRSGAFFVSASWLVRPMIGGPFGVFLIDLYNQVARNVLVVPFFSLLYEHAKDGDIMVRIVYYEMVAEIGRIFALLLALAAFVVFPNEPWTAVFVLGALFSVLYAFMPTSPTPKDRRLQEEAMKVPPQTASVIR